MPNCSFNLSFLTADNDIGLAADIAGRRPPTFTFKHRPCICAAWRQAPPAELVLTTVAHRESWAGAARLNNPIPRQKGYVAPAIPAQWARPSRCQGSHPELPHHNPTPPSA